VHGQQAGLSEGGSKLPHSKAIYGRGEKIPANPPPSAK